MKNEQRRYFLVEFYGKKRTCILNSVEEVDYIINEVRKYNNRKSSKFLYGNITVEKINDKFKVESFLYRKYTNRMTISEIDSITNNLNEKDLTLMFKDRSKTKKNYEPDINIAYFETKNKKAIEEDEPPFFVGVKYIPVLYKEDCKYLDKAYIKRCLFFHAEIKDYEFFRDLANEFSAYHFVSDEIRELYTIVNKCENMNENLNSLFMAACKLYNKFILEYERDESLSRNKDGEYIISQRRLRDFGFFIKNYGIRDAKINSPFK